MRIGVDARELRGRSTGVGRYLGGLLRQWTADEARCPHEFLLYSPEPFALTLDERRFRTRVVPGSGGTWWEQVQLAAAAGGDRLDVFFAPGYSAPLRLRPPTVVAIHDVSFFAHPEWFRPREGMRRRWLAQRTGAAAHAVITISHFSRREIVDHLGIDSSRVRVIPPGIARHSSRAAGDRSAARVLYVGSLFTRRHVPDLIRAFAPIVRRHPSASLDIVGENRTYPPENLLQIAAHEGVENHVRWRPYMTDEDLGALYGSARAFAFLSEYEGLGLTPLEALAAGVPPVLLDTAVARESCRDAALYVRPGDLVATNRAIELLLFDEPTRTRLLEAAPAALGKYDWARAAADTLAVLEESA
jgi:glycosyltransferase involved in cell wall biosynthesis